MKPLWNANFTHIWISNLLLSLAFNMLMPTIPIYLTETLGTATSLVGVVMASYSLAVLLVRPFSGFLVDTVNRKTLYLVAFIAFSLSFVGYMYASTVALMVLVRMLQGSTWGLVSVAGNTLAIDVTPSERRGEGVGVYGLTLNLGMAIGPLIGSLVFDAWGYEVLVIASTGVSLAGLLFSSHLQIPRRETKGSSTPLSLDRFILISALPVGLIFLLFAMSYGALVSYAIIYGNEQGIAHPSLFFLGFAVGIGVTRIFAGKWVDRGYIHPQVMLSMLLIVAGLLIYASSPNDYSFVIAALLLGSGYGMLAPAIQYIFVSMTSAERRGTATSTYLISFDVGISLGMTLGGYIAGVATIATYYYLGALISLIAGAIYWIWVRPYYNHQMIQR